MLFLPYSASSCATSNARTVFEDAVSDIPIGAGSQGAVERATDVREIFGTAKAAFGFSVSETARLFSVSRKTLYAWLASEDIPQPHRRQIVRALAVERTAEHAMRQLSTPIGTDAELKLNGHKLMELVSNSRFKEAAIVEWIDALASRRRREPRVSRSFSEQLKNSGFAMPPGANEHDPRV